MKTRDYNFGVFFHAAVAAACVVCLYFTCCWGIPLDFTSDLSTIYATTKQVGFQSLICKLFNPLTPAWFFLDDMMQLRPGQFLILKLMEHFHGMDLPTSHAIAFAGMGFLAFLLFLVLWEVSGSTLLAWLGVLLYGTFPTHVYSMISDIPMDFQYWELLLTMGAILLFWRLLSLADALSVRSFWLNVAGVIVLTCLAIKLKSAAKVVPFIFSALLAVCAVQKTPKTFSRRFIALAILVMALFVLVVPMVHRLPSSAKESYSLQFNLHYAAQRIFQSRPENVFQLFTLKRFEPGSITESYGFFLGWVFWGGLTIALLRAICPYNKKSVSFEFKDLFLPSLLWFLAAMAGFAMGQPPLGSNNRYLNYGLLPSVLLLFSSLCFVDKTFPVLSGTKKIIRRVFVAACIITILQNTLLFVQSVRHLVAFQWASVEAEKEVFRTSMQREPMDHEELFRFHFGQGEDMLCHEWERDDFRNQQEILRKLQYRDTIYLLSRSNAPQLVGYLKGANVSCDLQRTLYLYDAPPLIFKLAKALKRGKEHYVCVFQLRRGNALAP